MDRLIARLLLLFALVGNFIPLALAAGASPVAKCCLRKAVHPCHKASAQADEGFSVHSNSCCSHDCCRAVTPAHWAHPEARSGATSEYCQESCLISAQPRSLSTETYASLSTRAPPQSSIL
jgi:hypothetical protein